VCGIFGSVNKSFDLESVKPYLFHRGPDDQRRWSEDKVNFYHFRLSILDISGGIQPMTRGSLTIIFNGQIYNHQRIREKYNLKCNTDSDTETILALYELIGEKCLNEMDGMFAFALYNSRTNEIFLARDRAGKKPLYVYQQDRTIVFSSELNVLRELCHLCVDERGIHNYLNLGSSIGSTVPYKHVRRLLGGEMAVICLDNDSISYKRWWGVHDYYEKDSTDSYEEAKIKVDKYLSDAVQRRLDSSDLEVGTFLSGGIDSGLVTAIAAQYKTNLKTFTVSFDNNSFDESQLAGLVANSKKTF